MTLQQFAKLHGGYENAARILQISAQTLRRTAHGYTRPSLMLRALFIMHGIDPVVRPLAPALLTRQNSPGGAGGIK